MEQTLMDKLTILADSAKYDVAAPPAALPALPGPERWAAAMRRAAAMPLPPTAAA